MFDLDGDTCGSHCKWHLHVADNDNLSAFTEDSKDVLCNITIPRDLLSCNNINCDLMQHHRDIDHLYNNLESCLHQAAKANILHLAERIDDTN